MMTASGFREIDRRPDHLAESTTAAAQETPGFSVPFLGKCDEIADVRDLAPLVLHLLHQRPAARDRFQAAGVTAPARHAPRCRDLHMAYLARRSATPSEDLAVGDHACAEAGGGLDGKHIAVDPHQRVPLGERQNGRVVVDQHRRFRQLVEVRRHTHALPVGHQR